MPVFSVPAADFRDADDWQFLLVKSKAMLNNLTGLRFYTAIWVFLYHFCVYTGGLDNFFVRKGYLGVDIFFVLSGFILTYAYYKSFFVEKVSWKKYHNFILKRFAKIYPLQILTFFIVGILLLTGKYIFHQKDLIIRPDHIISNLLMIHAWNINDALSWNTHSWSLSDEWFAYLFLFITAVFFIKVNKLWGRIALGAVVLFFIVKWFRIENFDLNEYTYNGLERIVPEFFLGISVGLLRYDFQLSKRAASSVFVVGCLMFLILAFLDYKVDAFCMIAFAAIIYALSFKTYFDSMFDTKTMVYLGNISFAFYMFQLTAFYLFKPFQAYIAGQNLSGYIVVPLELLLLVIINLALASLSFRYFEEPARIYLVERFKKE
ncbi:acyltransferase [Epilithonimonas vandammei]|uniref:Acyltransferase n=2 Tax=Epilithonimonas vandammei TaxID=2487072 RepID=A0A3G8ZI48_9FLAO|nr:acyltransferase [Epilithonimonas vandammei]